MHYLFLILLLACTSEESLQQDTCAEVPAAFSSYVNRTLADSTDLFQGAYPPATPLSCELLGTLQEELKDDSARYCFERLSRRFWMEDPHARVTHAYIRRHMSFALSMAAAAHWNEDHRIRGLLELQEYRGMRPLVCTTKEGNAVLEKQDRAAVRYLIRVLETTPLVINGSENATIHDSYMREVMRTLDLFTGRPRVLGDDRRMRTDLAHDPLEIAIAEWRSWLGE
ncbi:MAG TPA: hypothetical protein PLB89_18125 [Flavobacteriales bacterium]|nr:hypothetical protein [Flavobacteriales bacterium]